MTVDAPAKTGAVTSHSWRPPHQGGPGRIAWQDRPCEFMNCRRLRTEHARSVPRQAQR